MEIKLDLKIILFAILFYFTRQLHIYILFMTFALMHEISHIIVARILGYKLKVLKIMPIGFSIYLKTNIEDYNKKILNGSIYNLKKIIISIAGPLSNIIIFLITLILNINISLKTEIIYINAIIAIFNLLPIYPLDGAKIIKNILKIYVVNEKAYKYTLIISNISLLIFSILCVMFIIYSINIATIIILIYLWYVTIKENKIQKIRNNIYKKIKIPCKTNN